MDGEQGRISHQDLAPDPDPVLAEDISLVGTSDIIVQRFFLMMQFSGFQIIVGETDIITLTQLRLSDCIFSVCIITLTQNLLSVNQLPVNCLPILFRCILASLQEHYDLEC